MDKRPLEPVLPLIEERELGVREYWYETFRRVLVVPLKASNCYLLSIDIYKKLDRLDSAGVKARISIDESNVEVIYMDLAKEVIDKLELGGAKPINAELVIIVTNNGERIEASNARLQYCGLDKTPSYEEVKDIYKELVKYIEGRDPLQEPFGLCDSSFYLRLDMA